MSVFPLKFLIIIKTLYLHVTFSHVLGYHIHSTNEMCTSNEHSDWKCGILLFVTLNFVAHFQENC